MYLGGNETIPPEVRESNAVQIRCTTTRLLGEKFFEYELSFLIC